MSESFWLVTPNWGRSISDDEWEIIDPAHIQLWRDAVTLLRSRKVNSYGSEYAITFDWTRMVRSHERSYAALKYLNKNAQKLTDQTFANAKFPVRAGRNKISLSIKGKDRLGAQNVVENTIHDIFLIMNIAGPGSCDFHRATLVGNHPYSRISLSNYHFEAALNTFLDDKWPVLRILELGKVINWYDAVRQGVSQLPQNPMERVLFSLLHLSKIDTSPMAVIWLFYAFESLLQTRVGENFSAIVKRISLLLEADETQTGLIRKKIRELYEIRSAIVHGGFEVIHPLHDDVLDKRVQQSFVELLGALDYGYAILTACIQRIVEKNWRVVYFDEILRGELIA